jgi:hypothetical protein
VILVVLSIVSLIFLAVPAEATAGPERCELVAKDGSFGGQAGVEVDGACVPVSRATSGTSSPKPRPVVRVVGCGVVPIQRGDETAAPHWNVKDCGPAVKRCTKTGPDGTPIPVSAFVTQVQDPVTKKWTSSAIWCPVDSAPVPGTAVLRDRALRLLPTVGIGAAGGAGGGTRALANTQTILWAKTPAARDLGQVTVLGQRVWLRVQFAHARWDFGDQHTDTTSTPGKAYDDAVDPCETAMCPGYYGHVYTETGTRTITLTVAWSASYSLDGQHYAPIGTGTLTGPASTTTVTVRQARGVLVPNPVHDLVADSGP